MQNESLSWKTGKDSLPLLTKCMAHSVVRLSPLLPLCILMLTGLPFVLRARRPAHLECVPLSRLHILQVGHFSSI